MQKALPLLNDGGSIILNGSVASVKGTAAFGVYAARKLPSLHMEVFATSLCRVLAVARLLAHGLPSDAP